VKGRWLLADVSIGMIANNQGTESTWRWDRVATPASLPPRRRPAVLQFPPDPPLEDLKSPFSLR
jgi:hypothetical protein